MIITLLIYLSESSAFRCVFMRNSVSLLFSIFAYCSGLIDRILKGYTSLDGRDVFEMALCNHITSLCLFSRPPWCQGAVLYETSLWVSEALVTRDSKEIQTHFLSDCSKPRSIEILTRKCLFVSRADEKCTFFVPLVAASVIVFPNPNHFTSHETSLVRKCGSS